MSGLDTFHALAQDGTESWPCTQIEAGFERVRTCGNPIPTLLYPLPDNGERKCVLLTTGAMNPIHLGHVEMLVHARNTLEERHGFRVLAGFLSPSHDLYVGPKASSSGTAFAEASHRVEMARLAAVEHDWIEVATWEARQSGRWPDYPEVVDVLERFLCERYGGRGDDVFVLYVCGSDHLRYCGQGFGKPRQGLIAVPRSGEECPEDQPSRLVFSTPPLACIREFSSTAARSALVSGRHSQLFEASRMLGKDVLSYILKHQLYGTTFSEPESIGLENE